MTDQTAAQGPQETGRLIAPSLTRYHQMHRAGLAWRVPLAARVEQVRTDDPACPRGLARILARTSAPAPACGLWRPRHAGATTLRGDLAAHAAPEDDRRFPRIEPAP